MNMIFVTHSNISVADSTYEFQGMFFQHPFDEYEYEKRNNWIE